MYMYCDKGLHYYPNWNWAIILLSDVSKKFSGIKRFCYHIWKKTHFTTFTSGHTVIWSLVDVINITFEKSI